MDGTQAFIGATITVKKDGIDWIHTAAAVHCLYKESTMSIPQHADDAH